MFGLVVPGRLVETEVEAVDETTYLLPLLDPTTVNHITVFLTGEEALPEGFGASIYLCWPGIPGTANEDDEESKDEWIYMGFIANEKPSALFKMNNLCPRSYNEEGELVVVEMAQIGISITSFDEIEQATEASTVSVPTMTDLEQFLSFAVESLFNFAASFSVDTETVLNSPGENWFPMSSLQQWHERIVSRLSHDPGFWRSSSSATDQHE